MYKLHKYTEPAEVGSIELTVGFRETGNYYIKTWGMFNPILDTEDFFVEFTKFTSSYLIRQDEKLREELK